MPNTIDDLLERALTIPIGARSLQADLVVPTGARGIVMFAHGSGSSRKSPRNRAVASALRHAHFATLLLDLLTLEEELVDVETRHLRFDIPLLATRLEAAAVWIAQDPRTRALPIGFFGASTGAAAALAAAARLGSTVHAIVSRGGRPDLAGHALEEVKAPTLLIVGGYDEPVLDLNRDALARLRCVKAMKIVPRASHLFEERGAMEQVTQMACAWFDQYLARHEPGIAHSGAGW
ncbi:MAG TPA: hypothetical protein VFS59_15130 [Gemmatimonadaceae bacterium]|nr:hypothetical protein [Gemmatimonadaceae bacterium]